VLDLIHSLPLALLGAVIVAPFITIAVGGAVLVRRWRLENLEEYRETAGLIYTTAGVLYAVVLGFVVVTVWEDYSRAEMTVRDEANALADLYRISDTLDPAFRGQIRSRLEDYVSAAIQQEWPALARGQHSADTAAQALSLLHALTRYTPPAARESALYAEMLKHATRFIDSRRERHEAAQLGVQPALWWVLLLGSVLIIGFSCLFVVRSVLMHIAVVTIPAALIGMMFFLIVAMDSPFRGGMAIEPAPLQQLLDDWRGRAA